jgi:hypothetical protein
MCHLDSSSVEEVEPFVRIKQHVTAKGASSSHIHFFKIMLADSFAIKG